MPPYAQAEGEYGATCRIRSADGPTSRIGESLVYSLRFYRAWTGTIKPNRSQTTNSDTRGSDRVHRRHPGSSRKARLLVLTVSTVTIAGPGPARVFLTIRDRWSSAWVG